MKITHEPSAPKLPASSVLEIAMQVFPPSNPYHRSYPSNAAQQIANLYSACKDADQIATELLRQDPEGWSCMGEDILEDIGVIWGAANLELWALWEEWAKDISSSQHLVSA